MTFEPLRPIRIDSPRQTDYVVRTIRPEDREALIDLLETVEGCRLEDEAFGHQLIDQPCAFSKLVSRAGRILSALIFTKDSDNRIIIEWIGTEPGSRRLGLARELVQSLLLDQSLAPDQVIFLRVDGRNTAAYSFWRSLGFVPQPNATDDRLVHILTGWRSGILSMAG